MHWKPWRIHRRWLVWLVVAGFVLPGLVAPEQPDWGDQQQQLERLVGRRGFNFVAWELGALATKGQAFLARGQGYLTDDGRREAVTTFLEKVGAARQSEEEIGRIYAQEAHPAAVAQAVESQLAIERTDLAAWQPLGEAILEEQVSERLSAAGFGRFGFVWPPVKMHMTPLPSLLIISPRDHIERIYAIPLITGLTAAEMDALENDIFADLNLSAFITPIGGLGIYPAMVLETSNLGFLVDTIAHEWAHHWLTLHPLGFNYNTSAAMGAINETVASIVGKEIGPEVMARYYPDLLPKPSPPVSAESPPTAPPPAFDFRAEMRRTRVRVDELLAAGEVDSAESYLEERRQRFVANGYPLRKLNQAYFAFYGAYADEPGAGGADPIGPTVVALRQRSASLHEFLQLVAPVTSFEELQAVLAELGN